MVIPFNHPLIDGLSMKSTIQLVGYSHDYGNYQTHTPVIPVVAPWSNRKVRGALALPQTCGRLATDDSAHVENHGVN